MLGLKRVSAVLLQKVPKAPAAALKTLENLEGPALWPRVWRKTLLNPKFPTNFGRKQERMLSIADHLLVDLQFGWQGRAPLAAVWPAGVGTPGGAAAPLPQPLSRNPFPTAGSLPVNGCSPRSAFI